MGARLRIRRNQHLCLLRRPGRLGGILDPGARGRSRSPAERTTRTDSCSQRMRGHMRGRESHVVRPSFSAAAAVVSIVVGTSVAVYNMYDWNRYQHYFAQTGGSGSSVISFYLAQSISMFLLLLGFYLAYAYVRRAPSASSLSSLLAIIGSAVSDRGLARAAIAATALYGLLYAFTSSI